MAEEERGDLKRVIGFWGGMAVIVGVTIGSGIFRKPSTLAGLVPDPWIILGLWGAFGLISICGALALAELSSLMPKTGGVYVYLRAAYGAAVIVLRFRQPGPRPFATPLYPWVPLVFLRGTSIGLGAIVWGEWKDGNRSPVWGLPISLAGFPVYAVWRRWAPRPPEVPA